MLLTNATLATMDGELPYGLIEEGCIALDGDRIAWVGNRRDLPAEYAELASEDIDGCLITPGLIDCHTHLVHGGNRAGEFEMRLNGASYEEVARAGGGIVSTVTATRKASFDELVKSALPRLDTLISEGVCTIEIKSGYGLDVASELNMLRAARQLEALRPITVKTSFLGAHAIPKEYDGEADAYIDKVCIPSLIEAHDEGLVDAVDGFCEGLAFDAAQIERVFKKAKELRLPVKLHAEQLSNIGGTQLAAQYGALSADHIEYANEADTQALSASGTVAVLLPGAFYTLRETQRPPLDALRKNNVQIAVATDCNPGSSPLTSLLLTMNMACTLFQMTPEESLSGTTKYAALALGMGDVGVIRKGMRADLCIWDVREPSELSYRIGFNPLKQRIFGGQL
jgi:imidazolonepropionase